MTTTAPPAKPEPGCVLGDLLEHQAAARPDAIYAVFGDTTSWTFAQTLAHARRTAAGLHHAGLRQGDRLLIALPNGPDMLRVWFAANLLGAIAVPVNAAYRGGLLERVATNAEAALIVATADFTARLATINRGSLTSAIVFGPEPAAIPGLELHPASLLDAHGDTPPPPPAPIQPHDIQSILYTSGTTGPSKGVMCSYRHIHAAGRAVSFMTRHDRYMVNLPMYHIAGILPCVLMLGLGGSVAVIERFRTDEFWDTIVRTQATFVILLGVMTSYILNLPPSAAERASTLRHIIVQPLDTDALRLRERFAFDVYTSFNMTEISIPIISAPNPTVAGTCGRQRDGAEVRVVDDNDYEVPHGTAGELILRMDQPWTIAHGYWRDPEATARAWRNGWFHTGDAFRRDEHGNFYFVDRLKDTIRRRGENISSFEVEAEVLAHPAVREAAAVAVPSALSESEVLVVLSLLPGATLDPADLIAFLRPRLPYFMIPRFVRIVPDLPKTPTQKIEKHVLRGQGLEAGVWDREEAGITIRRDA